MLREGQQFAHYRIVHQLRSGGMGEVYLANDVQLHRYVAIKVIRTDSSRYPDNEAAHEAARLFLREMQAIGQLDHRHILPVYDSGEENVDGLVLMYMVMPFRQEGSFSDWLKKRGKLKLLSPRDVECIVKQAASALQHAHNHQIIHQDVKPSNFLIYGDAEHPGELNLQLADFGVAKFITTTSESLAIRGTPIYMAPEQWEGHPSPTTDQYALAVMAYELLTGRLPFVGTTYQEFWYQHHHVQPPSPSTTNPRIPIELDAVILRALSKDPRNRFKSVSAFARAFRQAVLNITAINPSEEVVSLADASTFVPTVPVPDAHNNPPPPSHKRGKFTGRVFLQFGFVVAFIVTSISFFYFATHSQMPTTSSSTTVSGNSRTASTNTTIVGANTTATANSNATSNVQTKTATTQVANSTATAQANGTSQAYATATAQAYATAAAYATAIAVGTPAINDSLLDNNKGNNWDVTPTAGGSGCAFTGGAYHAIELHKGFFSTCFAQDTNFSNFSYEAQMTFVSGDQGGIAFRADSGKGNFYYFHINRSGKYALEIYSNYNPDRTIVEGYNSAIKTQLNLTNLIAVVANANTFTLYVNMQQITTVSDNTYYQGQIGVIAESIQNPTEVVFNNAQVWSQ